MPYKILTPYGTCITEKMVYSNKREDIIKALFGGPDVPSHQRATFDDWLKRAQPGDTYHSETKVLLLLAGKLDRSEDMCYHCGHTGLEYGQFRDLHDDDNAIEQSVRCPKCGEECRCIFTLDSVIPWDRANRSN